MSIFMIHQHGTDQNKDKKPLEDTNEKTGVEAPVKTEGEVENMHGAAAPARDVPPGAEPVAVEAPESTDTPDSEVPKEKMIKIDGPISRVFTDALNKMLSTESYLTLFPNVYEKKEQSSIVQDIKDSEILQVYCWHADDLNIQDLTQITNEITRHTDRNYVIAIETANHVPNLVGLASELGKLSNVSFFTSTKAAASNVLLRLQK